MAQAVKFDRCGEIDVLNVVEAPDPVAGPGQVVVRTVGAQAVTGQGGPVTEPYYHPSRGELDHCCGTGGVSRSLPSCGPYHGQEVVSAPWRRVSAER